MNTIRKQVLLSPELWDKVEEEGKSLGLKTSTMIRFIVTKYFEDKGGKK